MFCQNCGKEIEEGAVFCTNCGASVQGADRNTDTVQTGSASTENIQTGDKGERSGPKKKGKGRIIAVAAVAVALAAAGVAGAVLYFTGDGYVSRKNMELAERCFDEEEYKDALTYCEEALKRNPGLTDAYLKSADILLFQEEYGDAVRILEKGLKRTRDDEDSQELLTEKIDEINRLETETVSKRLQEYLDKELAPQYGYADLGARVKEFAMDTINYEADGRWTELSGIAHTRICDLDDDGRDELMTFVLEDENMIVSVYEVEDNAVVKKAECCEGHCSDLLGYDEVWSLIDVESGKYVYYSQDGFSILGDGIFGVVKLYRYDGGNLYTPLVIDLGSGSSDFEYRAYQYDENGIQLSEELIYDESGNYAEVYTREYGGRRIEELFAEYGVTVTFDAGIPAAQNGYEELLAFNMWGDYRNYYPDESSWCDTVVYHFNDWDSPLLVYDRFLRGEETLRVREGAWYGGNKHTDWTFQDILEEVQNQKLEYSDNREISGIWYAFLDCGGDGVEEMQIQFVGLDIYAPGDDSDQTMVITYRDGQLELVYSCESWARSSTGIDYYGCISSGGSNGAGDYSFDMGYIDGNGDVQWVYNAEALWGWWTSYLSGDAYDMAFAGYEPDIEVDCYTINGEDYCVLYADEDLWEYQYFVSLCEQEGMQFVTKEQMDMLISQRMMELGIEESWGLGNGVHWNRYWYD